MKFAWNAVESLLNKLTKQNLISIERIIIKKNLFDVGGGGGGGGGAAFQFCMILQHKIITLTRDFA